MATKPFKQVFYYPTMDIKIQSKTTTHPVLINVSILPCATKYREPSHKDNDALPVFMRT